MTYQRQELLRALKARFEKARVVTQVPGHPDGTTYLVFEPLELLERLAALTPRPRINLLLYYGVLGARSAWRSRITASDRASSPTSL